jgi:hypothetical protein
MTQEEENKYNEMGLAIIAENPNFYNWDEEEDYPDFGCAWDDDPEDIDEMLQDEHERGNGHTMI